MAARLDTAIFSHAVALQPCSLVAVWRCRAGHNAAKGCYRWCAYSMTLSAPTSKNSATVTAPGSSTPRPSSPT